jgi:hypothetical protein
MSFLAYIGFSPGDYQVEKSIKIYSPKDFFLPYITSDERLKDWLKVDAGLRITDSTADSINVEEASGEKKTIHIFSLRPFPVVILNWQKTGEMNFLQKLKAFLSSPEAVIGQEMGVQLKSLNDRVQADLKAKEQ